MSIEAHRWALLQRTRSATTQCVLYVLANAAEPDGVAFRWWKRRDHWWPYITERACVTRATVFRVIEELAEAGLLEVERIPSEEGGAPVVRVVLNLARFVRWDDEIGVYVETDADGKVPSHSETRESAGGGQNCPLPSQPETELTDVASHGETEDGEPHPAASLTVRRDASQAETASKSPLKNPGKDSPQPPVARAAPAGPKEADGLELIGFATFWTQYPDHETDSRRKAAAAFEALSQSDRDAAGERVSRYAEHLAHTGRRPVGAWRWLQERRFTEYAPGAQSSRAQRWFVPEASEPWKAACALGAVAFGTDLKVPQFWCVRGDDHVVGASVPIEFMGNWQPWLVPFADWLFVEEATPQYRRWVARVSEIVGRAPVMRIVGRIDATGIRRRRLIGREGTVWLEREYRGLLLPLEWPPARAPRSAPGADPPSDLSAADAAEFVNS